MAAEDELVLPQVPEAKPDDPEDVSWALSTAEAMWARGDHSEGIKWVRKAAEAASDAEDDMRALQLAKAASELANLVARKSRASVGDAPMTSRDNGGYVEPPISHQPPVSHAPVSNPPLSNHPPPLSASSPPPGPAVRAPIPLPSKGSSQAPPARQAPRPFAATSAGRTPGPAPVNRTIESKGKNRRRSRENLEREALAAGVMDTSPLPAMRDDREVTAAIEVPPKNTRGRRRSRPDENETIVARLEDLERQRSSAEEWDASPTQNLTGDEMEHMHGDRQTALAQPPAPISAPPPPAPKPASAPARPMKSPSVRPPTSTVHDPEIQTSQAVRVVVWRDANGVHLAPAGTVVSSITIDAVLVVLEPGVDLTAWLSQRDR
ncbi:MAG: hypothetical protein JST00_24980 [Deltaproteobacteria bacterium]|nr:hypothetical protein [Deltaproteobacteria bacterium]